MWNALTEFRGGIGLIEETGRIGFRSAWITLSWLVVAALGATEGFYGRTIYFNDFVAYLDVSRAIARHEWAGALNPMWSPGYPLLIAVARSFAPATAEGEWYAISVLNLAIFLVAYGTWRFLIRSAIGFYRPSALGMERHPLAVWSTTMLFIGCCLGLENVSTVLPDLTVTAYFIVATALTLRLIAKSRVCDGLLFGLTLGTAVWVKGILIAFSAFFWLAAVLGGLTRRASWLPLASAAAIYLPFLVLLAIGMSWTYGEFTLGVTGPLNYATLVNRMPHYFHWQGGEPYGVPLHPSPPLIKGLPVFGFNGPLPATYAPYEHLYYWYRGYRQFFSPRLQALAFVRSSYHLAAGIIIHPILLGVGLALITSLIRRPWRRETLTAAWRGWPMFLPALLGFGAYFAIFIEERYLTPFVLVFGLLPFAPLLEPTLNGRRVLSIALAVILTVAGAAEFRREDGYAVRAAVAGTDFHQEPQWRLAAALKGRGLKPGDRVAIINGLTSTDRYHWAYVDHLRIVAEFGALPFRIEPSERMRLFGEGPEAADQDFGRTYWLDLTDSQRKAVLDAFRNAGARAVVSLSTPVDPTDPGWTRLEGTDKWLYEFPQ